MPQLNDATEALLRGEQVVASRFKRFWSLFANFALTDNVLEVAIGLIVAAAFTAVVNSFVSDIVLPIISLLPFIDKQMEEKFAVLREGPNFTNGTSRGYNTLEQAINDGAVVLAYGAFINKMVNFLAVALSLFCAGLLYSYASSDNVIKETVKCKYCRKRIGKKASRCINCTSWQDGQGKEVLKVESTT